MKQSTVLNVFQCLEDKGNLSPICIVVFFSMCIRRTICIQYVFQITEIMDNAQSTETLWQPGTSTGFTQIVPTHTHRAKCP